MPPNQGISQNNHNMLECRLAQTKERELLFVWPSPLLFLGSLLNLLGGLKKLHPCYQCSVIIPSGVKPLSEKVPFPLSNRNTWENVLFPSNFHFSPYFTLWELFFSFFSSVQMLPRYSWTQWESQMIPSFSTKPHLLTIWPFAESLLNWSIKQLNYLLKYSFKVCSIHLKYANQWQWNKRHSQQIGKLLF